MDYSFTKQVERESRETRNLSKVRTGKARRALVTGGAGFIGSHVVERLLAEGAQVVVVDNFDRFYDPAVKRANLALCSHRGSLRLAEVDIRDMAALRQHAAAEYDVIVHLAAKGGVRQSIREPQLYQDVNVRGTQNLLDLARECGVPQFVFASSSSVYGINPNVPWREDDPVLLPISPYAESKLNGERLGQDYSRRNPIRFVALRFFTVYGPRQRPDLAIHKFAQLMLDGKALPFFGDGTTRRDYTFIDDIVSGIRAAMDYQVSLFEVFNLGNNRTVSLLELVRELEDVLGMKASLDRQPVQPGDVPLTCAAIGKAAARLNYEPRTEFRKGLGQFVRWLTAAGRRLAYDEARLSA